MTLTLTIGVIFVAAVIQLATGFGFALVSVPLLVLVVEPHAAVLIALQVGTIGNLYQAVEGRRGVDRKVVARLLAGASVGLPIGWAVYAHSSPQVLKCLVGVVILGAVVALARGMRLKESSPMVDLLGGIATGTLTTCTGTNGPPLVAILQARHTPPDVFRGTLATIFCVLDALALALYATTGNLTLELVERAVLTVPGLLVGAWVGIGVRRLLPPDVFRRVVLWLLASTGIVAIVTALG